MAISSGRDIPSCAPPADRILPAHAYMVLIAASLRGRTCSRPRDVGASSPTRGDCMSDATHGERSTLNRRQLLRLSTAAGLGAALPRPAGAAERRPAAGAAATPGACSTPRTAVAKTQYGKVRGYVEDGVLTFKGVPYGASTGGENRWLPAKPPASWDGELSGPDLRRQLSAAPARLGLRADLPLPVDGWLAERGHAQGEHLDAEPDRLAARDVLHPRRRLHLRLGLRAGVAGRRADGAAP